MDEILGRDEVWREGYQAQCDGKELADNPYPATNQHWLAKAQWADGWHASSAEDKGEDILVAKTETGESKVASALTVFIAILVALVFLAIATMLHGCAVVDGMPVIHGNHETTRTE